MCPRCHQRIHGANRIKRHGVWEHKRCPTLSRRAFLGGAGALALSSCSLSRCDRRSDPTSSTAPPTTPSPIAPSPIGYSHVLRLTGPHAEEVAAAGGRLVMAEANTDGPAISDIRAAAEVMRRVGGTLLLVGLNWNDERGREESLVWYRARVEELIAVVGTAAVWFEPISEPWVWDPARAETWFAEGAARWRAAGGTVIGPLPHPCDLDRTRAMIRAGQPTVMDCSPVLAAQLSEPETLALVRLAVTHRATLLLYDTWWTSPWGSRTVAWLRQGLASPAG